MDEQYVYVNQKRLRRGYTTGSCGAAAACAASVLLFQGKKLEEIPLLTPKGIRVRIPVVQWETDGESARCGVIKFSGDDPDVTNGALVSVCVSKQPPESRESCYMFQREELTLYLQGGQGIGRVTRAGLSCPPGMWAINPVPRSMIFEQTAAVCESCGVTGEICITIEIPEGERLAAKTFNPQLGITGGLSVLGTSGIVEPMSETALLETIRLEIRQRAEEGKRELLMVPGNYGEQFAAEKLGLSLSQAVKCSNFIGNAMDYAVEYGIHSILLIGHAGKLLKVAAGVMNTHSSWADGRMECLAAYGAACGAPGELAGRILNCVTVEEALGLLEETEGLRPAVMAMAMERIERNLKRRAGDSLTVEAVLFTKDRGILGMTSGAEQMLWRYHK